MTTPIRFCGGHPGGFACGYFADHTGPCKKVGICKTCGGGMDPDSLEKDCIGCRTEAARIERKKG